MKSNDQTLQVEITIAPAKGRKEASVAPPAGQRSPTHRASREPLA